MSSHDFLIGKAGPVNHLWWTLVERNLEGNFRMVWPCNWQGREGSHIIQMTSGQDLEDAFLRVMRLPRIRGIQWGSDPLEPLTDNPRIGIVRDESEVAQLDTIAAQWSR